MKLRWLAVLLVLAAPAPASAQTQLMYVYPDVVTEQGTAATFGPPDSFWFEVPVPVVTNAYVSSRVVTVASSNGCGATLIAVDANPFEAGRLINDRAEPVKALPIPLQVRARDAGNPNPPFSTLGSTPTALLTYVGPVNSTATIDVRQQLNAADAMVAGDYRKTLTIALVSGCGSPPDTQITAGPGGGEVTNAPVFAFNSSIPGSTFKCRLDGPAGALGTFAPCTSDTAPQVAGDGEYRLLVRSANTTGETDLMPDARRFVLDRTAPATTIGSGPSGPTATSAPSFGFASNDTGARFECLLDGPGAKPGFYSACTPPHPLSGLADGSYTFSVRAIDAVGNVGAPATRSFTVDTAAPDTAIALGPDGPTTDRSPSFTFKSTEPEATFECSLGGAYEACSSPHGYKNLALRAYTFSVRARDAAGNVDLTPATRAFTVVQCLSTSQRDRDKDGLRDACEPLPIGDVQPKAGKAVHAEVRSGTVLVRQAGGRYVEFEGNATLRPGTTIDARDGEVALTTATNGFPATDKRSRRHTVRVAGGVFRFEQRGRAHRRQRAHLVLRLVSPPESNLGARSRSFLKASCSPSRPHAVVTGLKVYNLENGDYVIGRASVATALSKVTVAITNYCDGTRTKVNRGKVKMQPRRNRPAKTLRQGANHFEKV